jgi:peptide/nickel transport system substrate-binding protein
LPVFIPVSRLKEEKMRHLIRKVVLLLCLTALVACGAQQPAAEPSEPETVEIEVPVEVTRIVEGTPVVETVTETVIVTATPAPEEPTPEVDKTLVVCMSQEPNTLIWTESALVTSAVLEAVQEPTINTGDYGYQANLVEKLPSYEDGDAVLEEITVSEGDVIYDLATDSALTLTAGMTESFTLAQMEGDPLVVEAWDGSDLTTVQQSATWTLVEGLTWEDGTPVTAQDSVLAWELARDPNFPGAVKYTADRSATYVADDDRTVTWTGLPGFVDGTYFININNFNPVPSHLYEGMSWLEILEDDGANRDPLGYGAYQVDEWIAGESINLTPNPNAHRGEPPLDNLIYRFVNDTNQLVAQLASGECDIGTQDSAFEGSLPLIRGFEEQGLLEIIDVAGTSFEHLDFNLQPVEGYAGAAATLTDNAGGLLFQNRDFRRAIAHCIDRQAIIDQAANGGAFVQHVYTAPDHPLYPGDDAITIYEFDPAAGLELLAGLGWTDTDGDGILDKDGQLLSFVHSTRTNPYRQAVTQIVNQQLLENCQIQTEIELVGSEYFADGPDGPVFGRAYDMGEFAWNTGVEPPCNLYISSQIPNEVNGWGASNNLGWSNPEFDAACNGALQTTDEEEKAALHAEAMRIFTEEVPSLVLSTKAKIAVIRPGIEGVVMDPTINSEMWNVENFDINLE